MRPYPRSSRKDPRKARGRFIYLQQYFKEQCYLSCNKDKENSSYFGKELFFQNKRIDLTLASERSPSREH
jgi:hypothetical protein